MKALLALLLLIASAAEAPAAGRDRDERLSSQFPRVKGDKGLFVGSIRACRDTVTQVNPVADPSGFPALEIVFTAAAAARLRSETAALVGRPIRFRLDGRTVIAPTVLEEITGGRLHISGPPALDVPDLRRAALGRC